MNSWPKWPIWLAGWLFGVVWLLLMLASWLFWLYFNWLVGLCFDWLVGYLGCTLTGYLGYAIWVGWSVSLASWILPVSW